MATPKLILKIDLETYLKSHPKFYVELIKGDIFVPKEYRAFVNTVLSEFHTNLTKDESFVSEEYRTYVNSNLREEFGGELPSQMKLDAYFAELHLQHGCEPLTNLVFEAKASKASAQA